MKYGFIALMLLQGASFKETQLKQSRVKTSYDQKEKIVKNYFEEKNIGYAGAELFLRAFKQEQKLEVWIKEKGKSSYGPSACLRLLHQLRHTGPKTKGR